MEQHRWPVVNSIEDVTLGDDRTFLCNPCKRARGCSGQCNDVLARLNLVAVAHKSFGNIRRAGSEQHLAESEPAVDRGSNVLLETFDGGAGRRCELFVNRYVPGRVITEIDERLLEEHDILAIAGPPIEGPVHGCVPVEHDHRSSVHLIENITSNHNNTLIGGARDNTCECAVHVVNAIWRGSESDGLYVPISKRARNRLRDHKIALLYRGSRESFIGGLD